jgi:hypothetical protein
MIVDIAFVMVPTLLGFGAAGLIGSTAIGTAKEITSSIREPSADSIPHPHTHTQD